MTSQIHDFTRAFPLRDRFCEAGKKSSTRTEKTPTSFVQDVLVPEPMLHKFVAPKKDDEHPCDLINCGSHSPNLQQRGNL